MKLKLYGSSIVFNDEQNTFEISKLVNDDIRFMSKKANISFTLNFRSRNIEEWQSYELFASLMRDIIGNYILEDHETNIRLPKDFIDLKNKIIIWHSDSGTDNTLKLIYDDRSIIVSITKDPKESIICNNAVRVRTDGSRYENYYQYFTKFYSNLIVLATYFNKDEVNNNQELVPKRRP